MFKVVLWIAPAVLLLAGLVSACSAPAGATASERTAADVAREHDGPSRERPGPVVATLFMMSRCPHCARAVRALVPLARELGDRLELRVDYVGGEEGGRLVSPHGEAEVRGDLLEICVHRHAPRAGWMAFLECFHQRWREIPDAWQGCAEAAGVDEGLVEECADGEEGRELLRASFRRAVRAGVDATPTLQMGPIEIVGARPPSTIASAICGQLTEPLPALCDAVDPLPYVPVTFLVDERCRHEGCDVTRDEVALRKVLWGANVRRFDVSTEAGRAIYRQAKVRRLPALVIGSEIEDDPEAVELRRALRKVGDLYVRVLGRFEPEKGAWAERRPVGVKVLTDGRCPDDLCSTARVERSLKGVVPGLSIEHVDYTTEAGLALHRQISAQADPEGPPARLPLLLFTKSITDDDEFFAQVGPNMQRLEAGYLLTLGEWDPTAEICGNGVDDDENGRVDCRDEACQGTLGCRPEKRRRLELYAMSQCPFAAQVFTAMKTVVDHFGRDRTKIDFHVGYIGTVGEDGELRSMHGPAEVAEDIRQLCAQEHFGEGQAFVDYLACRAASFRSPDWERCATAPLDAEVIRRCAEGEEGPRLLRESFERAEALGITSSPSWLLNNRVPMRGRTPPDIVEAFCEENPSPECEQAVPDPPRDVPAAAGGCGP